ncbi:hypothetical protein [Streptomyces ardesiacus]|uniref:hypothetical protein n=1 Tax=Streptomyces ardesiacus TaxID=285564 RepID=UPI0036597289
MKTKFFEITTATLRKGRMQYRMITALSVVRCLSVIKDQTTDPVTKENLQIVIDLIHDSKPTF